jgi:hypothetical protein
MTVPPADPKKEGKETPMNEVLRERVLRRLDALPQDRQYQVLDYIEFLESKYAQRQAPGPNVFQRFAEGVEDTMRAGNLSASTVAEAMGFLGKAMGVLGGVAAAGKSVAADLAGTAKPKPPAPPAPPESKPGG